MQEHRWQGRDTLREGSADRTFDRETIGVISRKETVNAVDYMRRCPGT